MPPRPLQSPSTKDSTPRAWRVVVASPGPNPPEPSELSDGVPLPYPRVVLVTPHLDLAQRTLVHLRGTGARVSLVEAPPRRVSAWCTWHDTELAAELCESCGARICRSCQLQARGALRCPGCFRVADKKARFIRLRQLMALLLFTFFLYEVHLWLQRDRASVDPRYQVNVVLAQFVPPDRPTSAAVRLLNGAPDRSPLSLAGIAAWFGRERERYTGQTGPYLNLTIGGPWPRALTPPVVDLSGPLIAAWTAWRHARYFQGAALDQGIDVDPYAVEVYVVFQDEGEDLASHSRTNEKSRMAVAWIDLDETNPAYALVTVAHELAHALGAQDLYDPDTFRARFPQGYADPAQRPLFPQRQAELMAVDIPTGPKTEREVSGLHEVAIGAQTAADLGWISQEQAAITYEKAIEGPYGRRAEVVDDLPLDGTGAWR